ncbi:polyphosphate kinase 1 [Ruminococcus sp.]|uniref:polyphosphate kinase 1 n=1 Tax=Ruminococcus sp. TaxID=41978 RepID=UPI0025E80EDD|nr:polyphosphate kinase 1 [Ruminococcus sp.]
MSLKVYDNRELSWLKFNERVLEEARDSRTPLLERLLFQSIFASNLDEFFRVRVGSLYDASLVDDSHKDNKSKMRPSEQLNAIFSRVHELVPLKDKTFRAISKELELAKISHISVKNLDEKQREFLDAYYAYEIKPFLNAFIIDKRHPFPFLANGAIYAVAKLSSKAGVMLGIVGCSEKFQRVIILPSADGELCYTLVEDVILHYAESVFSGYKIEERSLIRVTRNADIDVDEGFDDELDARQNMSVLISKRKRLCPVRLQLSKQFSELVLDELLSRLELSSKQVFVEKAPLDMSYVFAVFDKAKDRKLMFFPKQEPQPSASIDPNRPMIEQIDEKDRFLHYPYESIKPFLRLLDEAAKDETVTSIKMTLYRVAKNSKVIKALCNAAENGKEVLVLVELRARFDEENNIGWSKLLEESGCHVMYGPQGLKVHSKLCLITRKVDKQVKYTVQVGTGNYNEKTAGLYTDLCLMTADRTIAEDACEVFRTLSMGELVENSKALMVAPHCLQNNVLELMEDEIKVAMAGGEGYVAAKLNSLTDKVLMDKIIECSQAGVKVELVIRGISCLVAGVPGVTENVHIRSIVGRYLEHARIYIFGSGVRKKVYISSADYMTRNTTRRVEVAAPILDEDVKKRVLDIFATQMQDNVKARIMQPDGKYARAEIGDVPCDAQNRFFNEAYANTHSAPKPVQPAQPAQAASAPITEAPKPEPTPAQDTPAVKADTAETAAETSAEPKAEPPKKKGFFAWLKRLFHRG